MEVWAGHTAVYGVWHDFMTSMVSFSTLITAPLLYIPPFKSPWSVRPVVASDSDLCSLTATVKGQNTPPQKRKSAAYWKEGKQTPERKNKSEKRGSQCRRRKKEEGCVAYSLLSMLLLSLLWLRVQSLYGIRTNISEQSPPGLPAFLISDFRGRRRFKSPR